MRIAILTLVLFHAACSEQVPPVDSDFNIEAYQEKANNHLSALTEAHQSSWNIGAADRWDADQETGILTWKFPDGVVISAPFQIVGTFNTLDNTFLWGWDHPSVVEPLQKDAEAVLQFAKKHDIDFLQNRKVECDEDIAWEFVALATSVCDRQGAYRAAAGTTLVFMTFGDVNIQKQP